MKTAEEFFYRIYPKTIGIDKDSPIFPFSINEITDLMEQFRKESIKEAFIQVSLRHATSYITEEFQEWYNNQIKGNGAKVKADRIKNQE